MMGQRSVFTFCILLGVLSATVAESAPGSEAVDDATNSALVQTLVEVRNPAWGADQRRAMTKKVSAALHALQAAAAKTVTTEKGKQTLAKKVAATLQTMIQEKQAAAAKKKKAQAAKKVEPVITHVKNGANLLFNMAHKQQVHADQEAVAMKKAVVAQQKHAHQHVLQNALRQIAVHRANTIASNAAQVKASEAVMQDELDLGVSSSTRIAKAHKSTAQQKNLHQYDNEDEEEEEDDDDEDEFASVIHTQDMHLSRVLEQDKAGRVKRQKRRAAEKKTKAILSELLGSGKKKKSRTTHSHLQSKKAHKVKKVKVQTRSKSKPVHKPKPVTEVDVVGSMLEGLLGKPKKKKIKKIKKPKLSPHQQRLASLHPDLKQFFGKPEATKKRPKPVAKVKTTPKPKPKVVKKAVRPSKPVLPVFHLQEPVKPKRREVSDKVATKAAHKRKSLLETALQEAAEADQKISSNDVALVKDMLKPHDQPKKVVAPVQKDTASPAQQDDIFNSFQKSLKKRVAKQARERKQEEDQFAATIQRDMAASKARRAARKARRAERHVKKHAKKEATHASRLHKLMHKAHRQMASDLGVTTKGRRVQHAAVKKQISLHFDPEAKRDALAAKIAKKLFANLQKHGKKTVTQEEIAAAVHSVPEKKPSAPVKALKKKPHTVTKHATKVARPAVLVSQGRVDKVFDKLDKVMEAKELLESI